MPPPEPAAVPVRVQRLHGVPAPSVCDSAEILEGHLTDASGAGPGHAAGLVRPSSEAEAAAFLRESLARGVTVLPQAARSSVTGGAIPRGEVVLSVDGLSDIGPVERWSGGASVTCGAGVRLRELQDHLTPLGFYYPPVPTYREAMLGGTLATNAGGAATFKYGATRRWVRGLRVLLSNGDLLKLERDQFLARPGESFCIAQTGGGTLDVPVPTYRLPNLKKLSAGYFAADPLDLIDLFIGSEGTLGLITGVTVDLVPLPAGVLTGLAFTQDTEHALRLGAALRSAAAASRERNDPRGPDIRAIEWLDGASLDILRLHGDARSRRIAIPDSARSAVLFEMELHLHATGDDVVDALEAVLAGNDDRQDSGPARLFRLLHEHQVIDDLELALPASTARQRALNELREAVPMRVGEALAQRAKDSPGVKKVGGDLVVPVDALSEMVQLYEEGFKRRGLEHAVWGHLADGNLHPNALPKNADETRAGFEALLEFADETVRRGGCPLSEHGVGRNPVKQELLRRFLGDEAIEQMRAVKRALDPQWRFAPGVLFPAPTVG